MAKWIKDEIAKASLTVREEPKQGMQAVRPQIQGLQNKMYGGKKT